MKEYITKKHQKLREFLYPINLRVFDITFIIRNQRVYLSNDINIIILIYRMNETKILIQKIKEGIQDKKGKK